MTALMKQPQYSLAPTNFAELERFANLVARSSFAPKAFMGKPGDVMVAVQMGMELGLSPMQALQNIAPVNGRPSVYGDAIPAICMQHPLFESIQEDVTNGVATCTVVRRGMPPVIRKFSVEDAKKAQLWGKAGPWQQYPERMLQMRARGFACRDAFPDALRGIITREEAEDIPRETVRATVVENRPSRAQEATAGFEAPPASAHTVGDAIGIKRDMDPIHAQLQQEMQQARDPEDYVIKARGKNEGKRLADLGNDSLSWYAENSRDEELKRNAQAVLELRIERETSANQAAFEEETKGDSWGLSGEGEVAQ